MVAVVAFIVRMRDLNTELTRRMAALRRSRPRSERLRSVEAQLVLGFAAEIKPVVEVDEPELEPSTT